jgi:plasmid stabilization system protein ParE
MKVEFTDFAKAELQNIYNYYVSVASDEIALKIIDTILDDAETLERIPNIGSKEILLLELNKNYATLCAATIKLFFIVQRKPFMLPIFLIAVKIL